jgi:hypothetical protein
VLYRGALGGGNMFQANQATAQIIAVTGGEGSFFADTKWLIGLVFAVAWAWSSSVASRASPR